MVFSIFTTYTFNMCVSGCMYHPAELYSGRNTWDSYSAGGPNKGQWAPVNVRPWSHTQRSAPPSPTHTFTPLAGQYFIYRIYIIHMR